TVMSVPADDPEMNRSMERARAEIDTFIARLGKPTPVDRNFALKAPVEDGDDVEHFWLNDVRYREGHFEGTIGNDPALVKNVKLGDSWRVARSEISDWMFVENGRLVGGYTIRVLLDRLDAEERQALLASLDFKVE